MRILFVTLADSTHTFRWTQQLLGLNWDLHLMPVAQHQPPHAGLGDITIHDLFRHDPNRHAAPVGQSARFAWPFSKGRTMAQRTLEAVSMGRASYASRLAALISRLRPDVVHTLEMQRAGYMMAEVRRKWPHARNTPWLYSCWGSDIYSFMNRPEHADRVREVVRGCDYLMADCQRDIDLAKQLGLRGEALGVFPGGGGYDVARLQSLRAPGPISARRAIAVKGYHDDRPYGYGRGAVAIRALRRCADLLAGYEIVIYSAAEVVMREAEQLRSETGVRVTIVPPSPPDEILKLMGRSRVGIGLSMSDGTPNTMLEAMFMGALPIQSDTVSPRELLTDGVNGFIVPPEDEIAVATAIRRALTDDVLVEQAALRNAELVKPLERTVVRDRVIAAYEHVKASWPARREAV